MKLDIQKRWQKANHLAFLQFVGQWHAAMFFLGDSLPFTEAIVVETTAETAKHRAQALIGRNQPRLPTIQTYHDVPCKREPLGHFLSFFMIH